MTAMSSSLHAHMLILHITVYIYIYTCFGGAAGVHVLISNYCNSPSEERGDSDSSSCGDFFFWIITCYYAVLDLTPLGL